MASIRKRGPCQWQVVIRKTGYPTQTKTFESRAEAQSWAADCEFKMARGEFTDRSLLRSTTLRELLQRYGFESTLQKRGAAPETSRLKRLTAHPVALKRLVQLQASDFSSYRDERLKQVSGKSVQEELNLFAAVLNYARKEVVHSACQPCGLHQQAPCRKTSRTSACRNRASPDAWDWNAQSSWRSKQECDAERWLNFDGPVLILRRR